MYIYIYHIHIYIYIRLPPLWGEPGVCVCFWTVSFLKRFPHTGPKTLVLAPPSGLRMPPPHPKRVRKTIAYSVSIFIRIWIQLGWNLGPNLGAEKGSLIFSEASLRVSWCLLGPSWLPDSPKRTPRAPQAAPRSPKRRQRQPSRRIFEQFWWIFGCFLIAFLVDLGVDCGSCCLVCW